MKIGDLVKLKQQGTGRPRVGVIYEHARGAELGPGRTDEYKCLWDDPHWNHNFYFERELEVVNEKD